MSVKILGGVARNFELATPKISTTRPTSVLLKRRLFDSIQSFQNKIFIDLCAGSGSIGLEALSRNAVQVVLVENSKQAMKCLKENSEKLLLKFPNLGAVNISQDTFLTWIKKNEENIINDEDVFIFFDPPYENIHLYEQFFEKIQSIDFKGKVIVEACRQKTMDIPEFSAKFGEADKIFKQGTSYLAIYDF